jgi:UDP-N-acetylmuramate dehydrogenase
MSPLKLQENVPLAPLSTLGIGGPARHYVRVESDDEVRAAVEWARERDLPLFVLGGGSNLVLCDEGHPGLVLHVGLRGIEVHEEAGAVEVTAAAGEPWDGLVARAAREGWAGVECLSGIPGLVGATPIQNVGAYGQDVSETVTRVEAFDLTTGRVVAFTNEESRFGYRESRFKGEDRGRYVVLRVRYRLRPGGAPALRYPELARHLQEKGLDSPTLAEVRDAVIEVRRRKSMVLDPDDPNARSVGSFFMNPIVEAGAFAALEDRLRREGLVNDGDRPPHYAAAGGRVKLSAAWLIERAGVQKGHRRGPAGISTRHTLAIVNCGGAMAGDVLGLAREIRDRVRERFGVSLTPEPVFVNLSWD